MANETGHEEKYKTIELILSKEIRPGRTLHYREINVQPLESSQHNIKNAQILFVHGSCAASSQYDDLIQSISNCLQEQQQTTEEKTSLTVNEKISLDCHLFDALGCGKSSHPANDWYAFSERALAQDLESITLSILEKVDTNANLFIVAHSYGTSQVIKLMNSLEPEKAAKIRGLVLLSGGLKDGPAPLAKDGGHWIWHYVPMFLLRRLQPSLNEMFVNSAIHPSSQDILRESAFEICNSNNMAMCKAFYRQQQYATSNDAKKVINPALVIHGENDNILPVCAGEHLHYSLPNSEFHFIKESSHQVFEEHPKQVAKLILNFITESVRE